MKMTCPHCSERIEVVFEAGERAAPCPSCQGEIAANAETSVLEARNLPPRRRPPDVRRRGNSAQASSSLPILLVVGGLVGLVGLLGLLCVGGVFGLMLFRVEPAPPGPGPLAREQEVKAPEMMPEKFVVRPGEPLPVPEEPKVVAAEPIAPPKEVVKIPPVKIPPVEKDDLPPVPPDAKQPAALVRADDAKGPRDLFGNALPQGALARLGASMFHHGGERHEGVVDLQFSADGKWIASAGSALIRIWNAADGKEALTFKTQPRVTRLALYPNRRGMPPQLLVSTGLDKTIRFWDLNTGAEMNKVINHPGIVSALTIAPDGKQLATASAADQHVYLWDMEDGKELRRWKPHNGGTAALAFSGDGKMLATGGAQNVPPGFNQPLPPPPKDPNTLAIWNLQTNERVQTFGNHSQDVYALVWSQNGKVFASAGADPQRGQSLIFWNADSGTRLDRGDGNFDLIPGRDFRLSADGKLLACGGPGGVAFWDTRGRVQQRGLENQGVFFKSLALSPDGATAATGDDHGDIVLWDVPRRARKFNLESHTQSLTGVAVSPDGKTIATSSDDGTARVWDRTGKSLRKIKFEQGRGGLMVRGLAFAPDGKSIALAHVWEGITIWDARDGQLKRHIQPNKRKGIGIRMNTLAFSPAGRYLAWAGMDAPAPGTTLWNLEKNQEERVFRPRGKAGSRSPFRPTANSSPRPAGGQPSGGLKAATSCSPRRTTIRASPSRPPAWRWLRATSAGSRSSKRRPVNLSPASIAPTRITKATPSPYPLTAGCWRSRKGMTCGCGKSPPSGCTPSKAMPERSSPSRSARTANRWCRRRRIARPWFGTWATCLWPRRRRPRPRRGPI